MKMNKKLLTNVLTVFLIVTVLCVDGRKTSRGRSSGSSRGSSSRRSGSNSQPAPTSFSSPQASAPKPSLFGWQERPAQKTQTSSRQSKPTNTHSYPSSNTGLSGNNQAKQSPVQHESVQRNIAPQSAQPNNQNHGYPSSNGLSGNSGTGGGYPQSATGLSGSNARPPPYSANTNNLQSGANYPTGNVGNNYNHGQGAPPPYSSHGNNYHHSQGQPPPYTGVGNSYHHPPPPPAYSNYGHGYGGHGGYGGSGFNQGFSPQMPGYFGNYGGNKGFGGVSRTSSALTGVGIAGAGIGTVLTGLALWNLARSTGRHQHTVIYDNRGQPVAVAPDNNSTANAMDSILGDLINCTLTISNENATEILAIPCAIATSFTPEADVKEVDGNKNDNDNTKCTITVVTKALREFMTTIPCSILLNTAAQNNVTEPPLVQNSTELDTNATMVSAVQPSESSALRLSHGESEQHLDNMGTSSINCSLKPGEIPDPINPCLPVTHNLTIVPLPATEATNVGTR